MESQRLDRSTESRQLFQRMLEDSKRTARELEASTGRRVELSNFEPLRETGPSGPCPYLGREAWIGPDGSLKPCCVPSMTPRGFGDLGNVAEDGILAVWTGGKYREFCRTYRNHPQCARCSKRGSPPIQDRVV
jgi:MoaA/NifB/PqqE/SkfB family radical SAM enzyme